MSRLLIATSNNHKLGEYAQLLALPQLTLISLRDIGVAADAPEDGETFHANSRQKAQYYTQKSGLPTLADDSGIAVDALNGAPGVYSARYGTDDLDDTGRRRLLLANVNACGDVPRTAHFMCVITVVFPDGREFVSTGRCDGVIANQEAGEGGFGYDPIFFLPERGCTIAQLSAAQKNEISHRSQAVQGIKAILQRLFMTI
ncbi:MAG: RdgB/HAM1 family non-canonical purine NTP pyrophosphatase [Chloroflexi bacterium]|nr:RdgB/HAM1 family non-canonical purine NTP pyrophosphatase [Chloroflexota bacterium]